MSTAEQTVKLLNKRVQSEYIMSIYVHIHAAYQWKQSALGYKCFVFNYAPSECSGNSKGCQQLKV